MMKTGHIYEKTITFSQTDFDRFAALSGDDNPIHVDAAYAARTRFKRPVAHGMFLFSHLCTALYSCQPEAALHSQTMTFAAPTYAGERNILRLAWKDAGTVLTSITGSHGSPGLQGEAHLSERSLAHDETGAARPATAVTAPSAHTYKGMHLGQQAHKTRRFTAVDIDGYRDLLGDRNPRWDTAVPYGLLGGLVSDLLGTRLPGRGTNWLKQRYRFLAPAPIDEPVTAVVQISRIRPQKALLNLTNTLTSQSGTLLVTGETLVLVQELIVEEQPMA